MCCRSFMLHAQNAAERAFVYRLLVLSNSENLMNELLFTISFRTYSIHSILRVHCAFVLPLCCLRWSNVLRWAMSFLGLLVY